MKTLVDGRWTDGFLDYHRKPQECRIKVLACLTLTKIEELYFVRSGSARLLWNYIQEIGIRDVCRKVVSRRGERFRNEKFLSIGVGTILESGRDSKFDDNDLMLFITPAHPMCAERVVVPSELLRAVDGALPIEFEHGTILHACSSVALPAALQELAGWSTFSGSPLPDLHDMFNAAFALLRDSSMWTNAQRLPIDVDDVPSERREKECVKDFQRKQGVLFGYGNYAKVLVLPNVTPYVEISCIHEIDPLQIPITGKTDVAWDTASDLRPAERYDVYFIAGFHHSHAPLAVNVLRLGACAVVEKPLAVDSAQLSDLLDAMAHSAGTLYCGFHKRYQLLNRHALQDLRLHPGEPVSYHCLVYEVPLPSRHWYRWPNSKSRLVSNGCHWIDHFLFLNNYCEVARADLFWAKDETINCSMELTNGALFTMVLTDHGSERIGVQDYIELRANGVTVRMSNGAKYEAESKSRILRRTTINKMDSYRRMYRSIGQKISQGVPGDTIESVRVSTGAVLLLEQQLNAVTEKGNVAWV